MEALNDADQAGLEMRRKVVRPQFLSGLRPFCFLVKGLARQGRGMLQEVDDVVRRLSYLFIVVIIVSSLLLAGYSPDLLSLIVVGGMCIISVLGSIYCLAPVISFTNGLRNGQENIAQAASSEGNSAWIAAFQIDRFFRQKRLDLLFQEYREKVRQQRDSGLIVSDLDDSMNEDVLGLYSWQSVAAQIPGVMTGLGILGTFIGLLMGLQGVSFTTVDAALNSVENILSGINTAFYTSIAGVILSILFNIANNILRNVMNREMSLFLEEFHKTIIPTTEEQSRYSDRRESRQIVELLERLPKRSTMVGAAAGRPSGNEQILMPQILDGLKRNEFVFFLQPRYELNTRKVIGAEALVRWNHPALGVISPAVFIPVLEGNGYITKLDQYIWEKVCQQVRIWINGGLHPVPVSVNVTKTDVLAMDVADFFLDMLKKYRIPPKYLEIDISEHAYLEAYGVLTDVVARLQQAGFRVILDGFNGDYIKLSSVGQMSTDQLKLDLRSEGLDGKPEALPQVFEQAKTLHLNLLAEGIESMEQLTMLRKCGCTEGQGYFFSQPLSVQEFEKMLKVGQNR